MTTPGSRPALIFDLDGTLIDSVYQHVIAWRQALKEVGVELAVWKIHRRIGMSGGLMVTALLRELAHQLPDDVLTRLPELHARAYEQQLHSVRPLPGAARLLEELTATGIPWIIATSGSERFARPGVASLGLDGPVPMVTREAVRYAKPDPDLFLAAAERLGVDIRQAMVVGDAVWDMLAARRAGALGVGLLSGATGGRSCCSAAGSGSTRTLLICSPIWMRSASADRSGDSPTHSASA